MKIEGWSDQSILYAYIICHNETRYSVQVIHNNEKQKFKNDEDLNCLNTSEVSLGAQSNSKFLHCHGA